MFAFAIYLLAFICGCQACFRFDEHQSNSFTTGSTFYQECQCTEPGYTTRNIMWLDNHDRPIMPSMGPGTNIFIEEEGESVNLHITRIDKGNAGTYKCVTEIGGKRYTQSYTIEAYDPLYFYQTPDIQFLTHEQPSKIMCQPKSDTGVVVSWQKEGDDPLEISDDDKFKVESDGLFLRRTSKADAGVYICTARVIATNEDVNKHIKVDVMTKPEVIELRADPDATVVVGEKLTIDCIASGSPHPEYLWNKTEVEGQQSGNVTWRQDINTIIFDSIRPDDMGNYSCYAFNGAGVAKSDIFVDVLIPPEITYFDNRTELEGTTIQLICNATGKPEPNITLFYIGKDPYEYLNNRDQVFYEELMPNRAFISLDISQEGIYICNATNEVASIEKAMYLTVLHRPYFETKEQLIWGWEGISVNLSCAHDSNPPATISWRFQGNDIPTEENVEINEYLMSMLSTINTEDYFTLNIDNDTDYGIYECSAKNRLGEDTKRILLKEGFKPDKINNVHLEDLTATSVTFQIYGPEEVNGPEIIGYTAQYDEEGNFNITNIHVNRTWSIIRPFKLDKLKPNMTYLVKFAAVNQVGTGAWSEYLMFTTLDKSVPEPPVWDSNPITLTRSSHVLRWHAADDNGEPIDYYTLRYCPESEESECKLQKIPSATSLELSDLEFNTTYILELVAHNSQGESMSANISVTVPAPNVDLPTTILSGGAIIAIAIVIVIICLLILDVILLVWRRQGIIASCCFRKDNTTEDVLNSRDKKGLLTPAEQTNKPDNGPKQFEYDKRTGLVTGKHSAV